ncbi:phytoene desaturase family protein [Nesterenkonia sandarakina]|uniref:4,4'-diaponeurosporene oxygenase n=1 Tax=Nesterenkonia sandarakina TaxID=272918 RepID=A0A7Z0J2R0_9MICC|nr:NAD(P)/FAD-dependent oxidoreductase [Nesterenkonia sandarakina]NYJ16176.1 phytoene dehydrogenase-like protein [Nesterenkonia sandarakina]
MSRVVVVGGGVAGLTASVLSAWAGHAVTLLEAGSTLGGKSHRIEVAGQRIDTGPSLFTFPAVWQELLRRLDDSNRDPSLAAEETAGLNLQRLSEVGQYYFRGEVCSLPVPPGHPWHPAWERFAALHGPIGPDVTRLLTTAPLSREAYPSLARMQRLYGHRLTTRSYLDSLTWLPDGLREVIAIHTLNAGVGPSRTPALYASMPAVMAQDGVWVPQGGIYELVRALERLARAAGVDVRTDEPVLGLERGKVRTAQREYRADAVVSGIEAHRLEALLPGRTPRAPQKLSCSAVAVYAALKRPLPEGTPQHSVVLPEDPRELYASLEAQREPGQTMAFLNYYPATDSGANTADTLAVLLTAPPNGRRYGLDDAFVDRELRRVWDTVGLPGSFETCAEEYTILDPNYFSLAGSSGGSLYGPIRPLVMSGPLHRPARHSVTRPWLWRVGASVHPGGGLPAVLGGAMMTMDGLLRTLGPGSGGRG